MGLAFGHLKIMNMLKNKRKVEKDWVTESGLRAVVIYNEHGEYRCGYVGVEEDSGYHSIEYSEIDDRLNVHGGVAFDGDLNDIVVDAENIWWFGYDCAHGGDHVRYHEGLANGGVKRSLQYCVGECENMATQLSYAPMKNYFYAKNILKGELPEDMHKIMTLIGLEDPKNYFVKAYFKYLNSKKEK